MYEKPLYLTEDEAAHVLVLLSETPTLLARAEKIGHRVSERELLKIVEKARNVSWQFIQENLRRTDKQNCDCSKHERKQAGDCPAGRWWWECSNCGKKV
jgi:hypothetical protein